MKKYLLIFCIYVCYSCQPKDQRDYTFDENLSGEENIARYATGFPDMEQLAFLDPIAANRSVIVLGEEGHIDITSTDVKVKMIDYLQKKGFQSLGLEAAPFLSCYMFSNPAYYDLTKSWKIEDFWYFLWISQETFAPLLEAINKREIKLWGIDSHLGRYDVMSVQLILDRYSPEKLPINWDKLSNLFQRKFLYYEYSGNVLLSVDEEYQLMQIIDNINNHVLYLISMNGINEDFKAVLQWIRNINTAFSFVRYGGITDESQLALPFRNRDSQMAENILWITENFPKEKLIVWCANFHAAKDISQTTYPTDSLLYFTFQSMGEGIYNKLQDKAYMMAFTSLNKMSEPGKFEQSIAQSIGDQPFGFIDFEPLRHLDGFRNQSFESSVIMKKMGKWLYIFDGMYYIRDQEHMELPKPE